MSTSTEKHTTPDKWIDEYGDMLFHFCLARVNDRDLAMDLVQDTLLSALKKYDEFENKSKISTWLTAILKNKIIDHYRKNNYEDQSIDDVFFKKNGNWQPIARTHGNLENILENIEDREQKDLLNRCINKLNNLQISVIRFKYFDEWESDAICNELGISSSNLWVITHRAKLQLKK